MHKQDKEDVSNDTNIDGTIFTKISGQKDKDLGTRKHRGGRRNGISQKTKVDQGRARQ